MDSADRSRFQSIPVAAAFQAQNWDCRRGPSASAAKETNSLFSPSLSSHSYVSEIRAVRVRLQLSVAVIGLFIAAFRRMARREVGLPPGCRSSSHRREQSHAGKFNLIRQRGPVHPRGQPRRRYPMNSNYRGNRPLVGVRIESP